MKTLILFSLVSFLAVSATGVRADAISDAIAKLRAIPPADPKLEETMNLNDRTVPSVWLTARGACLNGSKERIPFDQILPALAALPRSAWGRGRFIIFLPFPPGISSPNDNPGPSEQVVKKVMEALKAAGIRMNQVYASA